MGSEEEPARRSPRLVASEQRCRRVLTTFTLLSLLALLVFCSTTLWPRHASTAWPPLPDAIVLRNRQGVEIHVLPTGAALHRLLLPDRDGHVADVALGMDEERAYSDGSSPYFGALVGRFANRIANASFRLDGRTHQLRTNEAGFPGALHGGVVGFDKVRWQATRLSPHALQHRRRGEAVRLRHVSVDGEEGFPGQLEVEVVYTLTEGATDADGNTHLGELIQFVTAVTDAPTVVNLAQHSYFNLAGHGAGESVLAHELTLHEASHVLPVDSHRIPTGEFKPVEGTPFDFTKPRRVGEAIDRVDGPGWRAGYDHCFVLHGLGAAEPEMRPRTRVRRRMRGNRTYPSADEWWWMQTPLPAATLREPASGRTMEIRTTAPGLQLYTSNFLDGTLKGTKDGARYAKYAGVCLETQSFPDGPNHDVPSESKAPSRNTWPTGVLRPGEQYRHTTVYRFSAR